MISKSIEGRTENQVKNRYFSLLKKNGSTVEEPSSTSQSSGSEVGQKKGEEVLGRESPFVIDFIEDVFYETVSFDFQAMDDTDYFFKF